MTSGVLREVEGGVDGDAQRRPARDVQWQVSANVDAGQGDDGHDGQDDGTPGCAHVRQGGGAQRGRHARVPGQVAKPGRFRATAAGGGQQRSWPETAYQVFDQLGQCPGGCAADQQAAGERTVSSRPRRARGPQVSVATGVGVGVAEILGKPEMVSAVDPATAGKIFDVSPVHGSMAGLSIFERTRELGVLRAVGLTRSQLRASIRWESVVMALQGTVLGLLIGVFFGWALVLSMKNQGITEFSIPVLSLTVVVVLAGLAGLVAAIPPGRRAAKLNILCAIASD